MSYSMASLIKKTIHGKTYYYARECRRIDGRPKIVWQKYLGRADDIIAALTQPAATVATPPEKASNSRRPEHDSTCFAHFDTPSPVVPSKEDRGALRGHFIA